MKKMFFVIRNNGSKSFIVPFYSQSEILDKLFTGDKLADANISQYNAYTKNFLKDNSANSSFLSYWLIIQKFYLNLHHGKEDYPI